MKKFSSVFILMVFIVVLITGCTDKELNSAFVFKTYQWRMKENMCENFDAINDKYELLKYSVELELRGLILDYEDLYKKRKFKPDFSDKDFWGKLTYINDLYISDPDKYSFCAPLVAIYNEIGATKLSEDDIVRIKDKILYALDYYYIDQTTTILTT